MKHLFKNVYFFKPLFIGFKVKSRKRAIAYNIIGGLVTVGIIVAIIV